MSSDDSHVPASHDQYLPTIVGDIKGVTIDTKDARYVAATKAAFSAGLSQNQFGRMLAIEAKRVVAAQKRAPPAAAAVAAPTPAAAAAAAPAAPAKAWKDMSFSERMVAGGQVPEFDASTTKPSRLTRRRKRTWSRRLRAPQSQPRRRQLLRVNQITITAVHHVRNLTTPAVMQETSCQRGSVSAVSLAVSKSDMAANWEPTMLRTFATARWSRRLSGRERGAMNVSASAAAAAPRARLVHRGEGVSLGVYVRTHDPRGDLRRDCGAGDVGVADGIGFKTDFLLKHCKAKDDLCAGYVAGVVDTYLTLMAGHMINKVFLSGWARRPSARRSRFSSTTSRSIRTASMKRPASS